MKRGNERDFVAYLMVESDAVIQTNMLPSFELPAVYLIDTMTFIQRSKSHDTAKALVT